MVNSATEGDGVWNELRLASLTNPSVYADESPSDAGEWPIKITIGSHHYTMRVISKRRCNFVIVPLGVHLFQGFAFSSNVNSTVITAINRALTENTQLFSMIHQDYMAKKVDDYEFCQREMFFNRSKRVGDPIEIWRLGEAFVLLSYGIFGCFIVLVLENATYFLRDLRKLTL